MNRDNDRCLDKEFNVHSHQDAIIRGRRHDDIINGRSHVYSSTEELRSDFDKRFFSNVEEESMGPYVEPEPKPRVRRELGKPEPELALGATALVALIGIAAVAIKSVLTK